MRTFFARVCGNVEFESFASGDGSLIPRLREIVGHLAAHRNSIALIHFPFGDIERDTRVDDLLEAYGQILDQCAASNALCIVGGQQPVNSFDRERTDQQLEVEQRAFERFGRNYLPIHRYMQSESSGRRLMLPLDSGDGRYVDDYGHELLFALYRNRLLEITASAP